MSPTASYVALAVEEHGVAANGGRTETWEVDVSVMADTEAIGAARHPDLRAGGSVLAEGLPIGAVILHQRVAGGHLLDVAR